MTPIEQDQHSRVTQRAWLGDKHGEPLSTCNLALIPNATHAVYGWSGPNLVLLATGDHATMETFADAENIHLRNTQPYVTNRYQTRSGATLENSRIPGQPEVPPQVRVKPICWTKAAPICHLQHHNTTLLDWLTIQDAQIVRHLVALGIYTFDKPTLKLLNEFQSSPDTIKLPADQIEIWQTWRGPTPNGFYQSPPERYDNLWSHEQFLQFCRDHHNGSNSLYQKALEAATAQTPPQ